MSRQKVRVDQVVVPAGTPDGHVPVVDAGELVYAAPSGGSGTGGELLTVDGTTPPENLTTESEDDWLYEG